MNDRACRVARHPPLLLLLLLVSCGCSEEERLLRRLRDGWVYSDDGHINGGMGLPNVRLFAESCEQRGVDLLSLYPREDLDEETRLELGYLLLAGENDIYVELATARPSGLDDKERRMWRFVLAGDLKRPTLAPSFRQRMIAAYIDGSAAVPRSVLLSELEEDECLSPDERRQFMGEASSGDPNPAP